MLTPAAISGGSTLMTTFRPSRTSSARKTRLIPRRPAPSRCGTTRPPRLGGGIGDRPSRLSPFLFPASPSWLLTPQPRHALLHVPHLRLELGVGILPQLDELPVVLHRLVATPLLLVQLAQPAVEPWQLREVHHQAFAQPVPLRLKSRAIRRSALRVCGVPFPPPSSPFPGHLPSPTSRANRPRTCRTTGWSSRSASFHSSTNLS